MSAVGWMNGVTIGFPGGMMKVSDAELKCSLQLHYQNLFQRPIRTGRLGNFIIGLFSIPINNPHSAMVLSPRGARTEEDDDNPADNKGCCDKNSNLSVPGNGHKGMSIDEG